MDFLSAFCKQNLQYYSLFIRFAKAVGCSDFNLLGTA